MTALNEEPRAGRAFSLIELLIVFTLITILITLMLPLASTTREAGRRSMCASRQRELNLAAVEFSLDHDDRLPVTDRQSLSMTEFTNTGSTDHAHWVNEVVFSFFRDQRRMQLFEFTCPNRGEEWVKPESSNPVRYRVGYYILWGRLMSKWSHTQHRWDSAVLNHDDPELVTTADINEEATANPNVTSGSHGWAGMSGFGPPTATPEEVGAIGTNIGRLDGSVVWEPIEDAYRRNATSSGGIKGWW